jgi:hypothetical protein
MALDRLEDEASWAAPSRSHCWRRSCSTRLRLTGAGA